MGAVLAAVDGTLSRQPLLARGDTRAVRHECWDALATVGASGLVYVWLTVACTVACRGDFFRLDATVNPVKLTLSPPPLYY